MAKGASNVEANLFICLSAEGCLDGEVGYRRKGCVFSVNVNYH
jgi:hypothetical protein